MPRYVFSIDDEPRPAGSFALELPDDAAALREAGLMQEEIAPGRPNGAVSITVWEENGRRVGRIASPGRRPPPRT